MANSTTWTLSATTSNNQTNGTWAIMNNSKIVQCEICNLNFYSDYVIVWEDELGKIHMLCERCKYRFVDQKRARSD